MKYIYYCFILFSMLTFCFTASAQKPHTLSFYQTKMDSKYSSGGAYIINTILFDSKNSTYQLTVQHYSSKKMFKKDILFEVMGENGVWIEMGDTLILTAISYWESNQLYTLQSPINTKKYLAVSKGKKLYFLPQDDKPEEYTASNRRKYALKRVHCLLY